MQRPSTPSGRPRAGLLILAYLAFVSMGLPDTIFGVAWPSIRTTFGLPKAMLGAAVAATAIAYFLSGLLAGGLMGAVGLGTLLAGSTALATVGVVGYGLAPIFPLFVGAGVLVGFGSGAMDASLNTYVAKHFAPRHMSWLHAAYALGATVGPAVMTALLAAHASWRIGYWIIAAALGTLAIALGLARHRWTDGSPGQQVLVDAPVGAGPQPVEKLTAGQALRRGPVLLQIATFFLYSGVEVATGQWSYTVLTEGRGIDTGAAGTVVTLFWTSFLVGRVALGFVVERIGPVRLVRLCLGGAVVAGLVFAIPGLGLFGQAASLALLGFTIAPTYAGLMGETPRRVGEAAAGHAIGFQVSAATAGVAAIPTLAGVIGERFGLGAIPMLIAAIALLLVLLHEALIRTAD